MTPDQADNLRNLFMESRWAAREASRNPSKIAHEVDDAAVRAFMDAIAEMVKHEAT